MIAKSTPERRKRAEERLRNIMEQIAAYEAAEQAHITCPYCGGRNYADQPFCCKMFAKASIAALERLRVEQAREQVERISEGMERHSRN